MIPAELEHSRQSMQKCWYDLVQAEKCGVSVQDLERMYGLYLQAVEKYNCCVNADQQEADAIELKGS